MYVLQLDKPIRKSHIESFKKEGYSVPAHYTNAGLFYVSKNGLTATTSFGTRTVQVRCREKAISELDSLEELLVEIIQ